MFNVFAKCKLCFCISNFKNSYTSLYKIKKALKSYSTEINQSQKFIMFEHILNLTTELVNLATHRDLFMCLLTFNSRKFLIEIVEQFSDKILENETLIRKYAELLNLLDKKEVFAYKTSKQDTTAGQNDDMTWLFQRFKESFYDLVYKFPFANKYLNQNCINNCIEFYFQRKLLPSFGKETIKQISIILDKYLNIKNRYSINVRKYIVETIHRRLKEYYGGDQKIFTQDIISQAILPLYERVIVEDDEYFHATEHNNDYSVSDLIEMKYLLVTKLIELTFYCNIETSMLKIIRIFDKIIQMEKTSSIELLTIMPINSSSSQTNLILSPPPPTSSQTLPIQQQQQQSNPSQSLNYLNKIINQGLIEIFEKHFSSTNNEHNFTLCCVEIYNILTKYLEYYYNHQYNQLFSNTSTNSITNSASNSLIRTHSSSFADQPTSIIQQQQSQIAQLKFFNYYANIRKDVFEFLLRIRSDKCKKLLLLNRNNRRKLIESKYLLITILNQTKYDDINEQYARINKCQIDFGRLLRLIENCLEKEIDWNVLMRVLNDLPYVLQYETDLIIKSDFIQHLFRFLYKKEINVFRNKPENIQKVDYIAKFYPLIASIILYHPLLDKQSQENILQYFAIGINSNRNRFCLETLTIAFTEMHETNSIQCGDILLKLSQFSPSQAMAQPVLELLSTMSDFKKLEFIFGRKELYISVLAIAIKYTNPLKFNSFIIQLAHYVICIWFIKCKPEIRKNYASFTFKGLHKEVILELELSKDTKSPNKPTINDTDNVKEDSSKPQTFTVTNSTTTNPNNKNTLTDSMKLFYKDLVEITMDFMSNNMYFDSSINTQLTSSHNRNEFFVDIYSNNLRANSMISLGDGQQKQKGLTKVWLAGNKIIEIKTGLFSNICLEDPSSYLLRKQRVNSVSINSTTQQQSKPVKIPTQAIDIPNQQLVNESMASSEQSSATSISNNNSFSSVSLTSNYKGTPSNGSNNVTSSNNMDKNINIINNNKNDSETDGTNKSEKDFFDETIDSKNMQQEGRSTTSTSEKENLENEMLSSTEATKISSSNSYENNKNNESSSTPTAATALGQNNQRIRNKVPKRRYKSGLPLTADRSSSNNNNDGFDFTEESYLRQYYESNMLNKQSKDDSSINIDMSSNKNLSNSSTSSSYMINENLNQKLNHSHVHHSHHLRHHHHNRSNDDTLTSRISLEHQDSFDSNDTISSQQQSNKNICNQNCWCNNLVEITCRYPTKIITYVSLIENNSSTSHFINTALFDKLIKSNKLSKLNEITNNNININNSIINNSNNNNNMEKPMLNTLAKIAANAIESRRNSQLSRISESSMLSQEMPNIPSNGSSICDHTQNVETSTFASNDSTTESKANRFFLNSDINARRSLLSRKGSFDLSTISSASTDSLSQQSRLRQQTTVLNQPLDNSRFLNSSYNPASQNQSNNSLNKFSSSQITQTAASSLDPSQVFLQLFQNQYIYNDEKDQPILIPENDNIHRSIKILDYMPAYMLHKVGVIYVGKNQAYDEKAILSNSTGSIRYKNFINGLGNLIYLKEMDTLRFYSGGMETDGSLGDFTLLWSDGIVQISFHVATMMLLKDEDSNYKKRHIGNDPTIIVYNESGEEYQFSMIKGDINCICIEIIPLESNTNIVKVKTNNEIAQSQWFTHSDPKFVSDSNLALIVRKMSLHASMASRIYRSQKDNNLFGDKWYDRLKQINRIRKLTKEHYAKQQQQQQQQQQQSQQNKSSLNSFSMAENLQNKTANSSTTTISTNTGLNSSNISSLNSVLNQSDFTNYI